jgi:DnaJ-domain-containing protein 1
LPLAFASIAAVTTAGGEIILFGQDPALGEFWRLAGAGAALIAAPAPFAVAPLCADLLRKIIEGQIVYDLNRRFSRAAGLPQAVFEIGQKLAETYASIGLRLHAGAAEMCRDAVLRQRSGGRRAALSALVRLRNELTHDLNELHHCAGLLRTTQAEFDWAYERVAASGQATFLDELSRIQAWIDSQNLASSLEEARWDDAHALLAQIRLEIERVRNAAAIGDDMPRSLDDAFRVLNVNRDTSKKAIKTVVDALRRVWHPDLAADESDRERRTTKMQQINVAWEIVEAELVAN